jgi:hypothetical protein
VCVCVELLEGTEDDVSAIVQHTPFKTFASIQEEFSQITSPTGTRIVICELREYVCEDTGKVIPEFDLSVEDDILISAVGAARKKKLPSETDLPLDYSLRVWSSSIQSLGPSSVISHCYSIVPGVLLGAIPTTQAAGVHSKCSSATKVD